MSIKKFLITTALALSGVGWLVPSANAALLWSSGDLILAFRASGGDGASTSYLVNIGSFTQFTESTPEFTLNLGTIGEDLSLIYGAGWYDRSDLFWGVFGRTTGASPTLYASRPRSNVDTQTSPWPVLSVDDSSLTSTASQVGSVTTAFQGLTQTSNAGVLVPAGSQTNVANATSYNYQVTQPGSDFGTVSQWSGIEGNFGNGTAGTVLDLWRVANNATTYRGNFSIDDEGAITFNAVPEPSIFALLALGGTVSLVFRRRRAVRA